MYDYFKGILTDKKKTAKGTFVSIEVASIGYLLEVTERDFICVQTSDTDTSKFYVSLIHREDSMSLFGFLSKEARDIFQILLSVSGVGAKMAIALLNEFDIKHSLEYISSLWRKKIPKLIASAAEDQYLDWYYLNEEKGKYKRCSRCGQIKLAHNKYFSKNKTSKDGFYSICKACRNSKTKKS